jgi:hypothetical protein
MKTYEERKTELVNAIVKADNTLHDLLDELRSLEDGYKYIVAVRSYGHSHWVEPNNPEVIKELLEECLGGDEGFVTIYTDNPEMHTDKWKHWAGPALNFVAPIEDIEKTKETRHLSNGQTITPTVYKRKYKLARVARDLQIPISKIQEILKLEEATPTTRISQEDYYKLQDFDLPYTKLR